MMNNGVYQAYGPPPRPSRRKYYIIGVALALLLAGGAFAYFYFQPTPEDKAVEQLQFDASVTETEKQTIRNAVQSSGKTYTGVLTTSAKTTLAPAAEAHILSAYVPVSDVYATKQLITKAEVAKSPVYVLQDTDETTRTHIAEALGVESSKIVSIPSVKDIKDTQTAFIPADKLSAEVKLLTFESKYYLDNFKSGGIFREATFSGESAAVMTDVKLNELASNDTTLKVNMTGVTALTRVMMRKLSEVKDGKYFSAKIGDYLADADITHVSNEVSFKEGCTYHLTLFCSPPEMLDALKDSGVDLVELTGNHNNDVGAIYNTESIKTYHSLGWKTIGGGLNSSEAAKPYEADLKGNKITFLAYNLADGAGSGAIAKTTAAGANIYSDTKAKNDIEAAKKSSQFVIVSIQYAECQAYPSGYVEYPECDGPIGGQTEAFRKLIDFGADMVVGSSAHQPQTYEMYDGKPIYYGLGNMYFDQTQWPGTERGIILTHYFIDGTLVQTKLSPTEYDRDFQTHLMNKDDALYLLNRLKTARTNAGLN